MKIVLEKRIWYSSLKTPNRLKSLKPVFKELLRVHQRYIDREHGDFPYWYKERAHTSLLAAAVWKYGGTALEEYGTDKRSKSKHGRCDLGIRINDKAGWECEAKQFSPNLGTKSAKAFCQKVNDWLKKAEGDVRNLQSQEGLALCFVTPAIHKSKARALDARLRERINLLKKESKYDVLVWIGIGIGKGQKPFGDEWKFPGLLLAIKEVQ